MSEMDRVISRLDKVLDGMANVREELGRNSAQHEAMTERIDSIHEQTKKTNGRVTVLESFRTKTVAYVTVISLIFGWMFKLML